MELIMLGNWLQSRLSVENTSVLRRNYLKGEKKILKIWSDLNIYWMTAKYGAANNENINVYLVYR